MRGGREGRSECEGGREGVREQAFRKSPEVVSSALEFPPPPSATC